MNASTRFAFVTLALVATATSLFAQRDIELIGRPSSRHVFQRPMAISDDGRAIALRSSTASAQGGFRWDEGTGFTELFGFYTNREPFFSGISGDGRVIYGYCAAAAGGASEAAKWSTRAVGDSLRDTPFSTGFDEATGASSDGAKIVGVFQDRGSFLWSNGSITMLQPPAGIGATMAGVHASAISEDGSVIVGYVRTSTGQFAAEWVNLVPRVLPGAANGSSAVAVARNGASILVTAHDHIYRFVRASGDYTDLGEAEFVSASPDGTVALATVTRSGGSVLVLVDGAGRHSVEQILGDQKIASAGARNIRPWAIGGGGRWLSGNGDADGGQVVWRTRIDPYISKPVPYVASTRQRTSTVARHVLLGGEQHDITWRSALVDTVDIFYSVDDGVTWLPVVARYASTTSADIPSVRGIDHSSYRWTIPGDVTRLARFKVVSARDASVQAISDTFTMRGVQYYRYDRSGLEMFRPSAHGWRFQNNINQIWPATWFMQFNYATGIDPVTGGTYDEIDTWWKPALPQHFPDWPLFWRTFGFPFGYRQTITSIVIDPTAAEKWRDRRGDWGGSCFGMSVSAAMAFSDSVGLRLSYPMFQTPLGLAMLALIGVNDSNRIGINMLQTVQESSGAPQFTLSIVTPWQTVWAINDMLNREPQEMRTLFLRAGNIDVAHAVLPYRVVVHPTAGTAEIHVYDPNKPLDNSIRITVDSAAGTWSIPSPSGPGLPPWTNTRLLELMHPYRVYMQSPVTPPTPKADDDGLQSAAPVTIGFHRPMPFAISAGGRTARYDSSGFSSNIAGCEAEFPITGHPSKPNGITLDAARVSIGFISAPGDTTGVYIHRTGATLHTASTAPGTSPVYVYDGGFTTLAKINRTLTHVRATTSDEDVGMRIDVAGYMLGNRDTSDAAVSDSGMTIRHRGASSTYDAGVLVVDDAVGVRTYAAPAVAIERGSTHTISYSRDRRIVTIAIDNDSNGTTDRTIELALTSSIGTESWLLPGRMDLR